VGRGYTVDSVLQSMKLLAHGRPLDAARTLEIKACEESNVSATPQRVAQTPRHPDTQTPSTARAAA
jgi:hypothetical protein